MSTSPPTSASDFFAFALTGSLSQSFKLRRLHPAVCICCSLNKLSLGGTGPVGRTEGAATSGCRAPAVRHPIPHRLSWPLHSPLMEVEERAGSCALSVHVSRKQTAQQSCVLQQEQACGTDLPGSDLPGSNLPGSNLLGSDLRMPPLVCAPTIPQSHPVPWPSHFSPRGLLLTTQRADVGLRAHLILPTTPKGGDDTSKITCSVTAWNLGNPHS